MDWREYAAWTVATAKYPGAGQGSPDAIEYTALGLGGETLELVEKAGLEDRNPRDDADWFEELRDEAGDVSYYLARLYAETGGTPTLPDVRTPPDLGHAVARLAGLNGRLVETVKKAMRGDGGATGHEGVARLRGNADFHARLDAALGGLSEVALALGQNLSMIADRNKAKVTRRKAAGTLHGSGDAR